MSTTKKQSQSSTERITARVEAQEEQITRECEDLLLPVPTKLMRKAINTLYHRLGFDKPTIRWCDTPDVLRKKRSLIHLHSSIYHLIAEVLNERNLLDSYGNDHQFISGARSPIHVSFRSSLSKILGIFRQRERLVESLGLVGRFGLVEDVLAEDDLENLLKAALVIRSQVLPNTADWDWIHGIYIRAAMFDVIRCCPFLHLTRETVYLVRPPTTQNPTHDLEGRLHNTQQPIYSWGRSNPIYFHHGVCIPAKFIENPRTLQPRKILRESNLELRRALLEIYGIHRVIEKLHGSIFHENEQGQLWDVELNDDEQGWTNATARFLRLINSTPEPLSFQPESQMDGEWRGKRWHKAYWLRVPPEIDTVTAGLAWTFGDESGQGRYAPLVES